MRIALLWVSLALALLLPALAQDAWEPFLDERVTVEGVARNAKLGALVQLKNTIIYVDGLDRWPADWPEGAKVRVSGLVAKRDAPPPSDEISGGVSGPVFLLGEPRWERL